MVKKSLHELLTYIWIPFMLGLVFYIFRDRNDVPLAIITLLAFSTVYTLVRLYFGHKKWWLLAAAALVVIGAVSYALLRPQPLTLSVEGLPMTPTGVSLFEGSVTASPVPGEGGTYAQGTVVTLTAHPDQGPDQSHDWAGWTGTDDNSKNPTTVTMNSRKQVSVTFRSRYSLIINNQAVIGSIVTFPEGSVSVAPAPGDDGKYAKDAVVTLTASPNSGYDWKNWTATEKDTSNPTGVTMSSRRQISVVFDPRSSLIINNEVVSDARMSFPEGSVTVNPAPGNDDKYARGTVITLTANPDSAYGLKNWSGTSSDTSNPAKVTINSDKHVTVTFELRFPLAVNNVPVNGQSANLTEGLVTFSPAPLADARYARDTSVTLTASPAAGYRFDRWGGDASGNSTSVTTTMSAARNISAVFKKVFNLTTSATSNGGGISPTPGGSVSPSKGTYDDGSSLTIAATPAPGYRFDHWGDDASGTASSVTITMNGDKYASAAFMKVYTLTVSVNATGSGSVFPTTGSFDAGATVTLTASPATGFIFDHWAGDVSGNVTSANVTMLSNRSAVAFFKSSAP